jgi:hypothetical protein
VISLSRPTLATGLVLVGAGVFALRWSLGVASPFAAVPDPHAARLVATMLVVPAAALVVVAARKARLPTHGTYAPMLVALAVHDAGPSHGLLLVAVLLAAGLVAHALVRRADLSAVARRSLMLTAVSGAMAWTTLRGARDGLGVALVPMVILTMTAERLGDELAGAGAQRALARLAGTLAVGAGSYTLFESETLAALVRAWPEANLAVAALLVWADGALGPRARPS